MRFSSLGSGSKGNATLVEYRDTCLLVDCGFSAVEAQRRLQSLGRTPADIDAVLVTHEHADHIKGVGALARKHKLAVYMTPGTHRHFSRKGGSKGHENLEMINIHQSFSIGDIEILPVAVPHDAQEPSQFIFSGGDHTLGMLTDLGSVSSHVASEYRACDALLLECNYDPDLLAYGPYPASVKRRVSGGWGHLSNQQSAQYLESGGFTALKQLVVAHISETNNSLECVRAALQESVEHIEQVSYAKQDSGFDWIELST